MNKRRRYSAKRRRRTASLKQMWNTGSLSSAELFKRLNGPVSKRTLYGRLYGGSHLRFPGRVDYSVLDRLRPAFDRFGTRGTAAVHPRAKA